MSDGEHNHEIFIIKRHGGHEDGHHGGVWKIAFADFMTAMMAFFLVMWLISANDKTKATIASYFNPVKLVDTTTQPKGLEDAKAVESSAATNKTAKAANAKEEPSKEHPKAEAQEAAKTGGEEPTSAKAKEKHLASALQDDPYAVLAEIAGKKGAGELAAAQHTPAASQNKVSVSAISHKGGEAFRDPFAPPPSLRSPDLSADTADVDIQPAAPGGNRELKEANPPKVDGVGKEQGAGKTPGTPGRGEAAAKVDGATETQIMAPPAPASTQQAHSQAAVADLKTQIAAAVKATAGDKAGPQVDVRKVEGGLLVSLTDTADFEMFSTASAVPTRNVILLMDKIGTLLKARPGTIVIRGFTDARPYKPGRYDNWHLSLDRAQTTHYMLVRGGFDEARIAHIEGYADRDLRTAANPASPSNRRIEILLKEGAP